MVKNHKELLTLTILLVIKYAQGTTVKTCDIPSFSVSTFTKEPYTTFIFESLKENIGRLFILTTKAKKFIFLDSYFYI